MLDTSIVTIGEQTMTDATQETTAPAANAPALGLADLKNVLIVIDLASSRGAFKPAEFAAVGSVYSKVATFLEAAAPVAAAAEEGAEAPAEDSAE